MSGYIWKLINEKGCNRWRHQSLTNHMASTRGLADSGGMPECKRVASGAGCGIDPDPPNPDMLPGQFMLKWPNSKINWNRPRPNSDEPKLNYD
jgi:hypothetical protein